MRQPENSDEFVSKDLKDELINIIKKLETNGNYYQITINEAFSERKVVIGDFNKRRYCIYGTNPEYSQLEGEYNSLNEIKNKIQMLSLSLCAEETKMVIKDDKEVLTWKCKNCHQWGTFYIDNLSYNNLCQNCHKHDTTHFDYLNIDTKNGTLYVSTGGSLCFSTTVGFLKFI